MSMIQQLLLLKQYRMQKLYLLYYEWFNMFITKTLTPKRQSPIFLCHCTKHRNTCHSMTSQLHLCESWFMTLDSIK